MYPDSVGIEYCLVALASVPLSLALNKTQSERHLLTMNETLPLLKRRITLEEALRSSGVCLAAKELPRRPHLAPVL
jgi:hypothetical protein